jgi:hypothetical protein
LKPNYRDLSSSFGFYARGNRFRFFYSSSSTSFKSSGNSKTFSSSKGALPNSEVDYPRSPAKFDYNNSSNICLDCLDGGLGT